MSGKKKRVSIYYHPNFYANIGGFICIFFYKVGRMVTQAFPEICLILISSLILFCYYC